jgi:hypothetical protein
VADVVLSGEFDLATMDELAETFETARSRRSDLVS